MSAFLVSLLLAVAPCETNADCADGLCSEGRCLSTAPAPPPDPWAEERRVRFGAGLRTHGGVMLQRGVTFLLLEDELYAALDVRLFGHHALRIQLGLAGGWPNTLAGETNVSLRFALSPRVSLGAGVFAYWGFYALRGGLEVPLSLRFGAGRRHELTFALRVSPGVYNNVTFYWWDFRRQYFALSLDAAVGYTFLF